MRWIGRVENALF